MAKYEALSSEMAPELAAVVTHLPDRDLSCEEVTLAASASVEKGGIIVKGASGYTPIASGYTSGGLAVAMEKVTAGATAVPVPAVVRAAVIAIPASAAYYSAAKTTFEAQGCKVVTL